MKNDIKAAGFRHMLIPIVSLFTSASTLVCCALPALLVTLGMGASMAGLIGAAPWITAISAYKTPVFIGAGCLLLLSAYMQWHRRNAPCPVDVAQAKACGRLRKTSVVILVCSIIIYLIGFFFAFLAADFFYE